MGTMDLRGITWIGSIYQKFEAMCLEIEEAMCQELLPPSSNQLSQKTVKYVENQVQTVGASMKRLCSDVVQELLPPSSKDPLKVSSADLLLNPYLEFEWHMKPKSVVKEDAKTPVSIKEFTKDECTPQSDNSNSGYEVWEDWPADQFNWDFSDNDEAGSDQLTVQASDEAVQSESREEQEGKICNSRLNVSAVSPATSVAVLNESSKKKGERSRSISASNSLRAEQTDTCGNTGLVSQIGSHIGANTPNIQAAADVSRTDMCGNGVLVSQIGSQTHANTPIVQADDGGTDTDTRGNGLLVSQISVDTCANKSSGPSAYGDTSRTGRSGDSNQALNEEETTMRRVGTIGQDSKSKFEETCVVVEGNDIHPITRKEEQSQSYKKKVQAAFSLTKKRARKQEYKQLASRYGNLDAESNMKGGQAIVPKNLPTRDLVESEWELL